MELSQDLALVSLATAHNQVLEDSLVMELKEELALVNLAMVLNKVMDHKEELDNLEVVSPAMELIQEFQGSPDLELVPGNKAMEIKLESEASRAMVLNQVLVVSLELV
ncbi:hypothetical protein ACLKA6_010682 [Drosophila palustris]